MLVFDRSGKGRGMRADHIETDYLIIGAGAVRWRSKWEGSVRH
jgi:hypothetical protein